MLEPMHAAVGKPNGGAPSEVLTGKIHVVCHNKTQKIFARHCVAKQCLGSDGEWHTQRETTSRPPIQAALQKKATGTLRYLGSDSDGSAKHARNTERGTLKETTARTHTEVSFLRTSRCEAAA